MAPSATQSSMVESSFNNESESVEVVNDASEPLTLLRHVEEPAEKSDVCIVGAGPTGLMLA
jgi:hypothetical protein